jgi:hypothetical protein
MKKLLSWFICVLTLSISSVGQASESFDIATFQPPKNWNKQTSQNSVQFSTEDKASGGYCLITLLKSIPGLGNSRENFDAAWQTVVKEMVNVGAPQMQPSDNPEDWKAEMGAAPFEKDGQKGVAVLVTTSGYGKMVNVLVLTNTQAYEPNIRAFLESVSLKKPEIVSKPVPVNNDNNASIIGTWGVSQSAQSSYSVNNGVGGYIKRQYTFNADGTYNYVAKTFRMTFDKLLLVKENGTYQISGNSITINPQKSVIQAWSKKDGVDKWGRLLTTQNRRLEKVTYQFTKHYFSGIQLWNLVLQADSATERDGPVSGNTTFSNAWYYAPISLNNPVIELPN